MERAFPGRKAGGAPALPQRIPVIWKHRRVGTRRQAQSQARPPVLQRTERWRARRTEAGLARLRQSMCRNRQQPISVAPCPPYEAALKHRRVGNGGRCAAFRHGDAPPLPTRSEVALGEPRRGPTAWANADRRRAGFSPPRPHLPTLRDTVGWATAAPALHRGAAQDPPLPTRSARAHGEPRRGPAAWATRIAAVPDFHRRGRVAPHEFIFTRAWTKMQLSGIVKCVAVRQNPLRTKNKKSPQVPVIFPVLREFGTQKSQIENVGSRRR